MRYIISLLLFALASPVFAQEPMPYTFKTFKDNACTPIKDQKNTGTCWAFSGVSLMESELIRSGNTSEDISEMFIVRCIYRDKAENYIRRQGKANLSQGGLAHDAYNATLKYGLCPQEAYQGLQGYNYNHTTIESGLKKLCDEILASAKNGRLPAQWLAQIDKWLDEQFGTVPQTFNYKGTVFTPQTYRLEMGIRPEDYVTLTSFTHAPMWSTFILQVPDNWSNGLYYNVPLDEMMRTINFAIQNGYTLAWDADVSNKGFSAKQGIAIVPAVDWDKKNDQQKANTFKYFEPQRMVDSSYRQSLFDQQETQDDHLMHIVGIVTEGVANDIYYKVKNSWGEANELKGYLYASDMYVRLNTIGITLHKSAIPQDTRIRLGIEPGEVKIESVPIQNPKTDRVRKQRQLAPQMEKANQ